MNGLVSLPAFISLLVMTSLANHPESRGTTSDRVPPSLVDDDHPLASWVVPNQQPSDNWQQSSRFGNSIIFESQTPQKEHSRSWRQIGAIQPADSLWNGSLPKPPMLGSTGNVLVPLYTRSGTTRWLLVVTGTFLIIGLICAIMYLRNR